MAWTSNVRIPDQQSKASPALAYYGGLHMVHLGDSSNDIWHSYYDGQTWRRPDTGEPGNSPIPGQASKAAPAIFTNNGLLHMVHLGDSSNDIWHSTFDKTKTKWSSDVRIPGQQSKASPALTEYWTGRDRVFVCFCGGCGWSGDIVLADRVVGHEAAE